jgi:hypothetical protein
LPQQRGPQLQADYEEHHYHPELGEVHNVAAAVDEPQRVGSDYRAGQQVTDHRSEAKTLRQRHGDNCRQEVNESLIESAHGRCASRVAPFRLELQTRKTASLIPS